MILNNIEKAKNRIGNLQYIKTPLIEEYFSKIYYMTTENLSGYLRNFSFQEKSVLTTGSSADQILNLIALGAKDIDHFDVNPFVKYYYDLKKVALLKLNPRKYLQFFNYQDASNNKAVLNEKAYYRLSQYLDRESKLFWDSLYELFNPQEIRQGLFFPDSINNKHIKFNNCYLLKDEYKLVRKNIENVKVNFNTTNIVKLPFYEKKYDFILLSNIFDYLYNLFIIEEIEIDDTLFAYDAFLMNLTKLLNDDGIMFFHYFWQTENNIIYDKVKEFFNANKNISSISFANYKKESNSIDSVMIYKKSL